MSGKEYKFKAILEGVPGGAYVSFPYDAKKEFGKARIPIRCTFDGEPYRGTLLKYGTPNHIIIVLKAIREKINKQVGDEIKVWLVEDREERTVDIPADFKKLLKQNKLEDKFKKFSYSHQKEWVQYISQAKREETRLNRMHKTIQQLKAKL